MLVQCALGTTNHGDTLIRTCLGTQLSHCDIAAYVRNALEQRHASFIRHRVIGRPQFVAYRQPPLPAAVAAGFASAAAS